jgi:SWI/SNF-related matrix-associated actin-dependent regulator of chromatin subfamily A3
MGLGKTITCVSLIASTLSSAVEFASVAVEKPSPPLLQSSTDPDVTAGHFAGSVWGMPESVVESSSSKAKAKATKVQDKLYAEYARVCRIRTRSRATLIICPLSTVSNWEDQFREHWKGNVSVVGGCSTSSSKDINPRAGNSACSPIRVYVYHGNSRKPDPFFLADFDAVITTYATLASEYSKQTRSVSNPSDCADLDEEDCDDSGDECVETDERGNQVVKVKNMKCGVKRKKDSGIRGCIPGEATSPLQSVNWFRVVLDEAQCVFY